MKKVLVSAVAIAAVLASPALAQTARQAAADEAQAADPSLTAGPSYTGTWQAPEQAFAQRIRPDGRVHSANPGTDVYDGRGVYLGSDPDPRVRTMLQLDPEYHQR